MPDSTVTLALDGDVPLEEFARAMGRFAELVNALSEEVGSPGLDWVVNDLQVSSAVATVRSSSNTQAAQKVVHAYTAVGSALENHTPVEVSRRVRQAANKVVSIQDKRVRAVRFETAEKDSVIPTSQRETPRLLSVPMSKATTAMTVTERPSGALAVITPSPSFGAIQGRVQTLSNRGSLRFTVYDLKSWWSLVVWLLTMLSLHWERVRPRIAEWVVDRAEAVVLVDNGLLVIAWIMTAYVVAKVSIALYRTVKLKSQTAPPLTIPPPTPQEIAHKRERELSSGESFKGVHSQRLMTRNALIVFLDNGEGSLQWILAELTARKIHLEDELEIPCPDLPKEEKDLQSLEQWRDFLYQITELASIGRVEKARSILKERSESEHHIKKEGPPVEPLLTRPNLTIGEAILHDGTTLRDIHGDALNLQQQDQPPAIAAPNVIPIRYGNEGLLEGLLLKNVGEKPALDIVVDPIQLGLWSVSFVGTEVTFLESGHTCFFDVKAEGPPTPLKSGSRLFRALRGWQSDTEDWGREVMGDIQYKDLNGADRKTTYKICVDVLNKDCDVIVKILTGQRN